AAPVHKAPPAVPCDETACRACQEKDEKEKVPLIRIDERLMGFSPMLLSQPLHDGFIDALPFLRGESGGEGRAAQDQRKHDQARYPASSGRRLVPARLFYHTHLHEE